MIRILIMMYFLSLLTKSIEAQKIVQATISSGSKSVKAGNYRLTYSIGAPVAAQKKSSNSLFTYGFLLINKPSSGIEKPGILIESITLTPNPVNEQGQLWVELATTTDLEIGIYNTAGQVLESKIFPQVQAGKNALILQTEYLTPGTYIILVKSGHQQRQLYMIRN